MQELHAGARRTSRHRRTPGWARASSRSSGWPTRRPSRCKAAAVEQAAQHRALTEQDAGEDPQGGRAVRRGAPRRRRHRGAADPAGGQAQGRHAARRVRARRQGPPRGGRGAVREQPRQGRPGRRRLRDHAGPPPRPVRARLHREDEGERAAAHRGRATASEQLRLEAEKLRADSDRKSKRTLDEAARQADEIVAQAKSTAERIRTESERELSASTQRRDSINAQLTNVRQMLATLTGASLPDPLGRRAGRRRPPATPRQPARRATPKAADAGRQRRRTGQGRAGGEARRAAVAREDAGRRGRARTTRPAAKTVVTREALSQPSAEGGRPRGAGGTTTARAAADEAADARRRRAGRRAGGRGRPSEAVRRGGRASAVRVAEREARRDSEDTAVRPARAARCGATRRSCSASSAPSGSSSPGSSSRRSLQARSVIVLIVVALFLAIGLSPVVEWLIARGLRRGFAIAIVFFVVIGAFVGFGFAVRPAGRSSRATRSSRSCRTISTTCAGTRTMRQFDDDYGVIERAQDYVTQRRPRPAAVRRHRRCRPGRDQRGVQRVHAADHDAVLPRGAAEHEAAGLPAGPGQPARAGDAAQRRGHQPDRRLRERRAGGGLHRRPRRRTSSCRSSACRSRSRWPCSSRSST